MFHKILVALDNSDLSQKIFTAALNIAQVWDGQLMLLHVLSPEEEGSPKIAGAFSNLEFYPELHSQVREQLIVEYRQQWNEYTDKCVEMLRSLTAEANTAGISAEFTQSYGSPGKTICQLAKNWQADLIVIGRRGRTGLSELFLGSVSNYVLHHAPCSVLTVQSTQSPKNQSETEQLNEFDVVT
jgi:nucleotide-binding universal stress UspA family protein